MSASNFRTADAGLAVVWPAIEADMARIAARRRFYPVRPDPCAKYWAHRRVYRIRRMKVGETRQVDRFTCDPAQVALEAERATGGCFRVAAFRGRYAVIERLADPPAPAAPALAPAPALQPVPAAAAPPPIPPMVKATVRVEPFR